jgi:hypothetical protein
MTRLQAPVIGHPHLVTVLFAIVLALVLLLLSGDVAAL